MKKVMQCREILESFDQLLGAPLSIQQRIEFFCDVDRELPCGILPDETAERIALRALNTCV